jgi:hypothetical protein
MPKMGGDAMSSRQSTTAQVGAAPAARRLGSSRWRDPRLAVGIILVAGSVVLGARVVASADDTVAVWTLRNDVSEGTRLTAEDVTVQHVHFESADDADRYFSGGESLPSDLVADHDLVAGELLAESALAKPEAQRVDTTSVPLTEGFYPPDLAPGDRVDVWASDDESSLSRPLMTDVAVLDVYAAGSSLDDSSVSVTLALEPGDDGNLDSLFPAAMNGSVALVRKGE